MDAATDFVQKGMESTHGRSDPTFLLFCILAVILIVASGFGWFVFTIVGWLRQDFLVPLRDAGTKHLADVGTHLNNMDDILKQNTDASQQLCGQLEKHSQHLEVLGNKIGALQCVQLQRPQ